MALVVIGTHGRQRPPLSPRRYGSGALRSAAERVSTDIHMVKSLSRKALSGDGLSPDVRAAVGEAFLLHVWSLREFYYGGGRDRNGVVAGDYFGTSSEWEALRPVLPDSLARDWNRLADQVRPVTRVDPGRAEAVNGRCPYVGFAADLGQVTRTFLGALPSERASWFEVPELGRA